MSYFDEILNGLDLTSEECRETFDEFQETAINSEGPIKTLENWNNNKNTEQKKAFLKGMIYSFFLRKATGSVKEEIENSMFQ